MPVYRAGEQQVRRKNLYRPCIMEEEFDAADSADDNGESLIKLLKATAWADNITGSEWKALLREPDFNPSAKSRLKKKAAGWLMALWRIAALDPELFEAVTALANETYGEQVKEQPRVFLAWEGSIFESGDPCRVGHPVNWQPRNTGIN